jgi:hypothetical protein
MLSPVSIVQQFRDSSDAAALARIEDALALVAKDRLTLDSDGRAAWRALLTGSWR